VIHLSSPPERQIPPDMAMVDASRNERAPVDGGLADHRD
jgi:hypothetical protein